MISHNLTLSSLGIIGPNYGVLQNTRPAMSAHTARLDFGWYWKERDSSVRDVADEFKPYRRHEWTAVSGSLPTEIHVELLTAQKIPHPQIGFNEHEVQCEIKTFYLPNDT